MRIAGVDVKRVKEELFCPSVYLALLVFLRGSCLIVCGVCWSTPGHSDDLGHVQTQINARGKREQPGHSSRTAHARPTSSPRSAVCENEGGGGLWVVLVMTRWLVLAFPFPSLRTAAVGSNVVAAVTARAPQVSMFPSATAVCLCSCLCLCLCS